MGAACVGAVPLKPCDLGLSHSVGIYSVTVSEISKAELLELLTWKERRQAEGCNVFLVGFFPAVSSKTLGNTENKHLWETFCL